MIVLWHDGGPQPCGNPALGLREMPTARYDIPAALVTLLDGTKPKPGDDIICGSCKVAIRPDFLRRR